MTAIKEITAVTITAMTIIKFETITPVQTAGVPRRSPAYSDLIN
jgi:hypothetical protein